MTREHLRTRGFTLIEVMGVVALISGVFFVALSFYMDLSAASTRAAEYTRDIRRATAILDRVARDFESALLLVKPSDVDPITWPWLFVGEARIGDLGADHIKFVTRNHDPKRVESPQTNLAVVAYTVERDENNRISLYRWSSPRLPESLDTTFPRADDEGSFLMAEGLHSFGVRFVPEASESGAAGGDSREEWNSTTLVDSGTLPQAVEIELAIADGAFLEDLEPTTYKRTVLIPVRPLKMEELTDPDSLLNGGTGESGDDESGEEEEEEGGNPRGSGKPLTVKGCIDPNPDVSPTREDLEALIPLLTRGAQWKKSYYATLPPSVQAMILPKCR